jgi:hypothetical protein
MERSFIAFEMEKFLQMENFQIVGRKENVCAIFKRVFKEGILRLS